MSRENNFVNMFFILLFIVVLFYLLNLGSSLIIPFLIAVLFSFAIIWLSEFYKKIKLPWFIAMFLSLGTYIFIFWLIWKMINTNIKDVINLMPLYQERISDIYLTILTHFNIPPSNVDAYSLFKKVDLSNIITSVVSSVTSIFSNAWIILFYVLFILLEYRYFWEKINSIFKDPKKRENTLNIINKIKRDIKSYFVIKFFVSFLTWLFSYFVMLSFWLNFALLWAMVIFLLNFIPNIWSIIAVFFPIVLSLIQYNTIYPFIFISTWLIWVQVLMWNIVEPKFMWNKLNLSPLVILISLWFWASLWWIVWMILSVPLMVIINIILAQFDSTRWLAIILSQNGELEVYDERVQDERKDIINNLTKKFKK